MRNKSLVNSPWYLIIFSAVWILVNFFMFRATQHSIHANGCIMMRGGSCITAQSSPINYWISSHQLYLAVGLLFIIIPTQLFLRKRLMKSVAGATPDSVSLPNSDKLLYSQKGGAWIGSSPFIAMGATWPFAKLEVYDDTLSLSVKMVVSRIDFKKTEITAIRTYKVPLSPGIKIEHTKPGIGPYVVFWSRDAETLLNKLRQAGYLTTGSYS
jgi:hypothetical protein